MVILRAKGRSSRNLLIRAAAYNTVQQRTIIPIQEMKAAEIEMKKRRMVRMPNRYGEEEGIRINHESSAGIYVTASVEYQCIFIAQNRNMKEEEKIKNTKVNALKRPARMNQRAKSFANLPPTYQMTRWLLRTPPTSSPSNSYYLSQPTSSRTSIIILAERWVTCLI